MGADYFTTQSLSDRLSEEIWLGEKFRLFILAVVMGVILAGTTVNYCVYQVGLEAIFKGNTFIWALILFGMLFIRSSNLQLIITRRMKKGKKNPSCFSLYEYSLRSQYTLADNRYLCPKNNTGLCFNHACGFYIFYIYCSFYPGTGFLSKSFYRDDGRSSIFIFKSLLPKSI